MDSEAVADTEDKSLFKRTMDLHSLTIDIYQELHSDVGGVIWDSALVVSHYIAHTADSWKGKKVLELGAGTGVCSIVVAAFGAYVLSTDLKDRLPLIHKNISANAEVIGHSGGEVRVKELDWSNTPDDLYFFDEIFLIDAIYYVKGVYDLIRILSRIKSSRILCAYEIRDIGEPKDAQKIFFDLISDYYVIKEIPNNQLDPVYSHPDIKIFYLLNKE